jgi:CBS domain-containing protein
MIMPTVAKFMTPSPHTVQASVNAKVAMGMMKRFNVRHLPVLDGKKLVGIISDRDLRTISCIAALDGFEVGQIMTRRPYAVKAAASLADVAGGMARNKYGAAIVLGKDDEIAGIITTVDLGRVLAAILKEITSGTSAVDDITKMLHSGNGPRWRR